MDRKGGAYWTPFELLMAVLIALIVVVEMRVTITVCEIDSQTEQMEQIIAEAQERIDSYYASLPARERPVVVSAAPAEPQAEPAGPVEQDEPEAPAWQIEAVPLEPGLQKALWDACQEFGVEYPLALAVIEQETNFCNLCGDGGRSIGYFQVQPRWWGDLMGSIGVDDLTDPGDNFRAGCAILAQLLERYDGSVVDALTAYNTGRPGKSEYAVEVMKRDGEYR